MKKRTSMIRARTEPGLKKKAELILRKLGISPSDAINIFYSQIVLHKGIPFEIMLEDNDTDEFYTEVRDIDHLKSMLNLK
ncbi:type II toxin-antitoxin system RelB/DinJ family antitoxin [Patescibacteria group bacterium]|nr:type II toxin-antitoxin system RelB/DinJ family antitoxin [Patescibacteria group bacterium]